MKFKVVSVDGIIVASSVARFIDFAPLLSTLQSSLLGSAFPAFIQLRPLTSKY